MQEKEEQHKVLRFEESDISNETRSLLTSLSELQTKLSLNTSDPAKLNELQFSKKLANIEKGFSVSKMEKDVLDIERAVKKEEDDVSILENFLGEVNTRSLVTDVRRENSRIETQKAINDVMSKLVSVNLISNQYKLN